MSQYEAAMDGDAIQNLIIGAGPAGLAVAGRMRNAGMDFVLIEASDRIASRWHDHYDRLHLHTVKRWSHLPHLPFPDNYPVYVSKDELITYYQNYAEHFGIKPRFDVEVHKIYREHSHWHITTSAGDLTALNVVVATGVNRVPNLPMWDRMEGYSGSVIHSVAYRNPGPFLGSRTLVIGMGNTGAEIALDLANAGVPTWISVRGRVNIVPRDLNGRPVQETGKLMAKLPFGIGDWLGTKIQRLYFGDLSRYGLSVSQMPPAVELKTTGKTPVIDIGTVKAIKDGRVKVVGAIKQFTPEGVHLADGQRLAFEHVILATGYLSRLTQLVDGVERFLDVHDYPNGPIGSDQLEGLYFVGFDNYKLGGILGTIYHDSGIVVDHLREKRAYTAG